MDVREGYKQTEVGLLPQDWKLMEIGSLTSAVTKGTTPTSIGHSFASHGVRFIKAESVGKDGRILPHMTAYIEEHTHTVLRRSQLKAGDLLLSIAGVLGRVGRIKPVDVPANTNQALAIIRPNDTSLLDPVLFFNLLKSPLLQRQIEDIAVQGAQANISLGDVSSFILPFPPTLAEQQAIAEALSDADALIELLEQLIAKKRQIKQGAMQELLTGKRRLPGFEGEQEYRSTELGLVPSDWIVRNIDSVAICLDNLRVPLNESERSKRQGDIPYCGANGVLDYIDDFIFDDDIILMAEDGGYFDEYKYRPIAYRMKGRCWVNNHAHVLKAKEGFDHAYLFYSLVHKNILKYLASGTRAKLNRSELNKIEVALPPTEKEQNAISQLLEDADREIDSFELKLSKARLLKQGMMQELLTGRIRLV